VRRQHYSAAFNSHPCLPPIVFGTNFDVGQKVVQNSLSLRERARVREFNKEYCSFSPSSCPSPAGRRNSSPYAHEKCRTVLLSALVGDGADLSRTKARVWPTAASLFSPHPQQYACVGESVSTRLSAIAPSDRGTVRIPQRRLWSGVPYPPCCACPADSLACCLLAYSPSQSLITSLISPGIAF
jgi:hypothetical protein